MKRAIVAAGDSICGWVDWLLYRDVPVVGWLGGLWRCRLADFSAKLDERWETGHWQKVPPGRRYMEVEE